MQFTENESRIGIFLLATTISIIVFVNLVGVASENHYMVRAFDTDESGKLNELFRMYTDGLWKPLTYHYGTAHTNIALVLAHFLGLFKSISYFDIVVISRAVNFLALIVTAGVFLIYGKTRRYPKWFFLFVSCLYFTGVNFKFSINAKPEHLQGLFVVCSVLCFKSFFTTHRKTSLFLAGGFAGFAFATKYAGGPLMVFEVLCLLWYALQGQGLGSWTKNIIKWYAILFAGGLCGLCLLGPYMLIEYPVILETLRLHSQILESGFLLKDQSAWYEWLILLFRKDMLWWGIAFWLLPALVWTIKVQKPNWREFPFRSIEVMWIVFYMVFLLVAVREINSRFMLVILPFLLDHTFAKLGSMDAWLRSNGRRHLAFVMFVFVFLAAIYSFDSSRVVASDIMNRPDSNRIKAGRWLSENISPSSLIAYDFYTYVPPEFSRRFHQPYLTGYGILTKKPDYIVSSTMIMSRYLDTEKAHVYSGGRESFMRHYYLYSKLNDDTFPGYRLVQNFDDVKIYKKLFTR